MAQFHGTLLTNDGLLLKAKGETNKLIEFTKIAVGEGVPAEGETVESLTALKSQKLEVGINALEVIAGGISKATGVISNRGLAVGFYVREIGLFAKDPDSGIEKLYSYTYVSSAPDWLPPEGGPTLIESEIGMIAVTGNATNITATIDDTVVAATKRDVAKVLGITLDDAITEILQGNTYVFPITNYDDFSVYSVDAFVDSTAISSEYAYYQDKAFHVSIPVTVTGSNLKLRLKKTTFGLDYFREITIPLFSGGIVTPTITFPTNNSDDISRIVTLQASAFAPLPAGSQNHSNSQWQISTVADFASTVLDTTSNTNLTSFSVAAGTLDLGTTYYARVRYEGSVSGWSAWSGVIKFMTAIQLRRVSVLVSDGFQALRDICKDTSGNSYACGVCDGRAYVVKYNEDMEAVLAKSYGITDTTSTVDQDLHKIIYHQGYLYAVGEGRGVSSTHLRGPILLKIDPSNLSLVDQKHFEVTNASNTNTINAVLYDVKADGDDIYVCGQCSADGSAVSDALVIRVYANIFALGAKRVFHAVNQVAKDIWAASLHIEATKISVLICGKAGQAGDTSANYAHMSIVTMDRALANPTFVFSKRVGFGNATTDNFNRKGAILKDSTHYFITGASSTTGVDEARVLKLDSNYAVVAQRNFSLKNTVQGEGAIVTSVAAKPPHTNIAFGDNGDIIFGGGYEIGEPYSIAMSRQCYAVVERLSKSNLLPLTSFVGMRSVNGEVLKYGGFMSDGMGNLILAGEATTGAGERDGFVEILPTNLLTNSSGPLNNFPELERTNLSIGGDGIGAADITGLTYTNNNSFSLAVKTVTYTETVKDFTEYVSDF